jgi:solute carrier family 6 GABA transporter-like protein 1
VQCVFVFYVFSYEAVTYGNDYKYPKWAEYMGLCMSFTSMIWVPGYAIYYLVTQPGTFREVNICRLICQS